MQNETTRARSQDSSTKSTGQLSLFTTLEVHNFNLTKSTLRKSCLGHWFTKTFKRNDTYIRHYICIIRQRVAPFGSTRLLVWRTGFLCWQRLQHPLRYPSSFVDTRLKIFSLLTATVFAFEASAGYDHTEPMFSLMTRIMFAFQLH